MSEPPLMLRKQSTDFRFQRRMFIGSIELGCVVVVGRAGQARRGKQIGEIVIGLEDGDCLGLQTSP